MSHYVVSSESQVRNTSPMPSAPVSHTDARVPFTEEERKTFRQEDYGAAKIIVGIMASVFTMGVALYLFIACLAAIGGH